MGTSGGSGGGNNPYGGLASTFGIVGTGLQAYGSIIGGEATASGDTFRAEELQRAAEYGDLKANQVNAQMTRNLAITLGKLDATRAAGHTDPFSPTGMAVRNATSDIATEQKNIKVTGIMEQAQQDEADAAYMRFAGNEALLAGDIGAAAAVGQGLSGAFKSMGT